MKREWSEFIKYEFAVRLCTYNGWQSPRLTGLLILPRMKKGSIQKIVLNRCKKGKKNWLADCKNNSPLFLETVESNGSPNPSFCTSILIYYYTNIGIASYSTIYNASMSCQELKCFSAPPGILEVLSGALSFC